MRLIGGTAGLGLWCRFSGIMLAEIEGVRCQCRRWVLLSSFTNEKKLLNVESSKGGL
ncbi:hypothetical protein D1AOALGA4SA_9460 [Olavius algarvensis Delta 1 endosymbiont]|nr:hypothetical protein D1AOALGA4SA_9460 [Olavius algarvensis Delta 1 endosymbiont]